jgi:hypothetical protein
VLPDSHDEPAGARQELSGLLVPAAVTGDLVGPVPAVDVVRSAAVLRAPVPEAAIDENRHTGRAEHNVGFAPEARQGCLVQAVTKPQSMQRSTKDKFGRRALASLGAHAPANCVAGGERFAPTFGQSDRP